MAELTPQQIARGKEVSALQTEMTDLGKRAISDFAQTLPTRLDFELAKKTNPKDSTGTTLEGIYQVVYVYVTSGKYAKQKMADLILRKVAPTEKLLSAKEEDSVETAFRNYARNISIPVPIYAPYIAPTPPTAPPTPPTAPPTPPTAPPTPPTAPPTPPTPPAPLQIKPTPYENKNLLLEEAKGISDFENRIQQIGPSTTMTIGEVEPTIYAMRAIRKHITQGLTVADFATIPQSGFNTNIISPGGPFWGTLLNIQVASRRYNLSAKKMPADRANEIIRTQGLDAFQREQQAYELK